jgi:hypothetical protein
MLSKAMIVRGAKAMSCLFCRRRQFLVGTLSALLTGKELYSQDLIGGCGGDGLPNRQLLSSSGDLEIDAAVIAELRRIVSTFGVNPGFKFIEGSGFYMTSTAIVPDTQGTVFIGTDFLFGEIFASDIGGVAIAGALAHECGHIHQMQTSILSILCAATSKNVELHSDFLAGFYMSASSRNEDSLQAFSNLMLRSGDTQYNNPRHHGTSEERFSAMRAGYEGGYSSISEASWAGLVYLERV